MKVILSVKPWGGERIWRDVTTSQKHMHFCNIDVSVLFNEGGVVVTIVEPISLNGTPMEDAFIVSFAEFPEGTGVVSNCVQTELSASDVCMLFGCEHPLMDSMVVGCYLHTLEKRL